MIIISVEESFCLNENTTVSHFSQHTRSRIHLFKEDIHKVA